METEGEMDQQDEPIRCPECGSEDVLSGAGEPVLVDGDLIVPVVFSECRNPDCPTVEDSGMAPMAKGEAERLLRRAAEGRGPSGL